MDYGALGLIALRVFACYTEWLIGVGGAAAEFEACLYSWLDNPFTEDLRECFTAHAEQWAALMDDYYGCVFSGDLT